MSNSFYSTRFSISACRTSQNGKFYPLTQSHFPKLKKQAPIPTKNFLSPNILSTRVLSLLFSANFLKNTGIVSIFLCYLSLEYKKQYCEMPQRKIWTAEEDRILTFLMQQRGLTRWSQISRVMQEEFQITGRSGKQCRQRYHNHLDRNINNSEWSPQEEALLFALQDEIGNKWSLISGKLPGRTDNCVKNHFYSKLRKSLRSLNKKIHKFLKKEYKEIKTSSLYKVIQTLENRNRQSSPNPEPDSFQLCKKIKNDLWEYESELKLNQDPTEELDLARSVIDNFALFDKDIKKTPRRTSLKSSAKFSEQDSTGRPSSKVVSSSKSIYDDSSQSYSNNSELFSSSNFYPHSLRGSQHLITSNKVFRSQRIQPESEDEDSIDIDESPKVRRGEVLYQSASACKSTTNISISQRMPEIKENKHQERKRENSIASEDQKQSLSSSSSKQDHAHISMFGQESLEMRLHSPERLTIEEKMQIHDQSNDALFYGNMQIQGEEMLIKDFQEMSLVTIPKLGRSAF